MIENGNIITKEREEFIKFLNSETKNIFPISLSYDKSLISVERLNQYQKEEFSAGVTLVGPHRDDLIVYMHESEKREVKREVRHFGSRGQSRMCVLQLKLLQLRYLETKLQKKPLLLLDDIFSELDEDNTQLVLNIVSNYQTVITTAVKFNLNLPDVAVIELK